MHFSSFKVTIKCSKVPIREAERTIRTKPKERTYVRTVISYLLVLKKSHLCNTNKILDNQCYLQSYIIVYNTKKLTKRNIYPLVSFVYPS